MRFDWYVGTGPTKATNTSGPVVQVVVSAIACPVRESVVRVLLNIHMAILCIIDFSLV